ncbi:hypothetical protein J2W32_004436 [Variovorax boronicumulans]|uniref:Peptidase S24/S26A/S26B/S26C domain-containing protein n=1 Tax=Variovorax boronicumulans TaxID=436515 RepID=A0AAW8D5L6_9BURK|nr:hypothetical protein [Variovorax boronicumulans]MDP9895338.1 hypothetical protein [Variovorax boronicumulans]MDQ0055378.1 hypothetical protein [Variovorax boronicumulans]
MSTAALLERPAARQAHAAESALALLDKHMEGVQIVQSSSAALPGEIEAGDLLRIDFDQHCFGCDGVYLLRTQNGWTGVRRITSTVRGPLIEERQRRTPLGSNVQILGRVLQVYAPRQSCFAEAFTQ